MAKRIYSYLNDEDYEYYEMLRDGVQEGKYKFSSVSEAFAYLIKNFVAGPFIEIIKFSDVIKKVEKDHNVKIELAKDSEEYGTLGNRLGFKGYFLAGRNRNYELEWDVSEYSSQYVRIAYTSGGRFVLFLYEIEKELKADEKGNAFKESNGVMHVKIANSLSEVLDEIRFFIIDEDVEGVLKPDINIKILEFLDQIAIQTGKEPPEVCLLDI